MGAEIQALVTEFAPLGALHDVLDRMADEGQQAADAVLVRIAMQVCEGMAQIAEEGTAPLFFFPLFFFQMGKQG